MYAFKEFYIPERMMGGIERYINHGITPGHFLTAVLKNDLMEAISHGDLENQKNLVAYAGYLYNEAPTACYGSPEKVKAWVKSKSQERATKSEE